MNKTLEEFLKEKYCITLEELRKLQTSEYLSVDGNYILMIMQEYAEYYHAIKVLDDFKKTETEVKFEPLPPQALNIEQPTLRDQFAMHVINGFLSDRNNKWDELSIEELSETAYYIADTMLKEREK